MFTGREAELERVESAFGQVKLAFIDGVAGVGKTTLALALAERWNQTVVFCRAAEETLEALIDDARLSLGPPQRPEPADNPSRILDLVRRLEEQSALLIVDDAHLLGAEACADLGNELALRLDRARAIFTSRQRWSKSVRSPEHMELHLEGLGPGAARRLWSGLDELYGTTDGFDAALDRSRGNPLFLRQAHAGPLADEDPLTRAVADLPPSARRLGVSLALAGQPLPSDVLQSVLGSEGPGALRTLVLSLIVEVDGKKSVRLHDLFREALERSSNEGEIRELRSQLARAVMGSALEPRIRLREVTRQLGALARYAELEEFLLKQVGDAVRKGATGELLRCMDRVAASDRSMALRIERARCIGRHYDQRLAFAELRKLLLESGPEPPPELRYALAEAAYDSCRAAEVLATLEPLIRERRVSEELYLDSLARYTAALTLVGRGEEGRAILAEEEKRTTEPAVRARLALHLAMLHNADEEYAEAAQTLARTRSLIDENAIEENAIYVPLTLAVIFARAGRFDESDALLTRIDLDASFEDESAQEFVTASRASIRFERGDRMGALEDRIVAQRRNEALGNVHYDLTNAVWHSRLLFALGRAKQADALLCRAIEQAKELGCLGMVARLERSRQHDPATQIGARTSRPSQGRNSELARWLAFEALRAAARGESTARESLVEAEPLCRESRLRARARGPRPVPSRAGPRGRQRHRGAS